MIDKCKTCLYRANAMLWAEGIKCDYLGKTGHARILTSPEATECAEYKRKRRGRKK